MTRFLRLIIVVQGTALMGFCFWFFVELANNQYLQSYLGSSRDLIAGFVGAIATLSGSVALWEMPRIFRSEIKLPTNSASLAKDFSGDAHKSPVVQPGGQIEDKVPVTTGLSPTKPSAVTVFVMDKNAGYNYVPEDPRNRFLPSREKKR